jgi:hypothetical protein
MAFTDPFAFGAEHRRLERHKINLDWLCPPGHGYEFLAIMNRKGNDKCESKLRKVTREVRLVEKIPENLQVAFRMILAIRSAACPSQRGSGEECLAFPGRIRRASDCMRNVASYQQIGAQGDSYGTFCVLVHSETWNTQKGGFFLNATRIGDHHFGAAL